MPLPLTRTRRALYRDYATNDFRPAVGSPLIDAGAESTPPGRAHLREAAGGGGAAGAGAGSAAGQPMRPLAAAAPVAGAPPTLGRAPDIGAYEFGDSVYWMPGRRVYLLWQSTYYGSLLTMAVSTTTIAASTTIRHYCCC